MKMPSSKNKTKDKAKTEPEPEPEVGEPGASESKEPSEAVEATESSVKKEQDATEDKKESDVITEVLDKMGLTDSNMSAQQKLDAMCLMFKQTLTENVQLKDALKNMNGQLEKNDMTKAALQKLCDALKTQVNLKDEENNLKLQEETQKRIDIAKNFETTMNELTKLIETHSSHNSALRDENNTLSTKMKELLKQFEAREGKLDMISQEFKLKSQLYEAQIAKVKVEKAEVSADFNGERLLMQKQLLEAKKNIDILLTREDNLKEQIEIYSNQYDSMSKGVNDKKTNVSNFKTQVDNLNKKLKVLEVDTTMWKEKFEESNDVVVKMNTAKANADQELEATKRKLVAMENLNRALQTERTQLLEKVKSTNQENGNH